MILRIIAEAEEDILSGALWYESNDTGLGRRFRDEVFHVLYQISQDPTLWRERDGGYRRVNCPVFPYYVAYVIRNSEIRVVAVAHGHREPGFWRGRLGP